ncbi:hypothetical protein AUK22_04285 [bacterium CG2_30_54_10]|nr:MAG: hypothetical protein AUK22_04285 [bacterium CG2_30_54_10]
MESECITVVLERITFANPQNGYSVLRASCRGHPNGVVVVGVFANVHPGEELRIYGTWTCHPQFGVQFHAFRYSVLKPATLRGIEKYLGSGLIKGIGPVTAKRLVAAFGADTLDVIEKDSDRLKTCPGIGQGRLEMIKAGWAQQKAVQDVMIFLQGHGISPAYAVRIFKSLGDNATRLVAEDPYILAYEINGIGFKTADKIAAEFGITGTDPRRVKAGLMFLLSSALNEGHLFLPQEELTAKAKEIMQFDDAETVGKAIDALITDERMILRVWEGRRLLYLPRSFNEEQGAANRLAEFLQKKAAVPRDRLLTAINSAMADGQISLTEQQSLAIELSLKERFLLITGGPGTGKTTTLKALVDAHVALGRHVALASPTGRAAKRLSEVTGREARTIHRLLEFSPAEKGFRHKPGNPVPCDTLVVDEGSMIDMGLFHSLIRALPSSASFVLVGDPDQLPSVGPGLVLQHLIASGVVPVVRLETIFRQAEASAIITNAHRINRGEMPFLQPPDGKTKTDCYFLDAPEPEKALSLLKNVVSVSLPRKFGYDPIADIQVLTPMNKGSLGASNLNDVLQETLNPPSPEKAEFKHMHRVFRVGDKVIQLRNNYDLDVFNGDIGLIRAIEPEDQEIVIEFPPGDRKVYQPTDLLDLALAYAITLHKSQGSEYPAAIVVLTTQHYVMLQRNLLYTGVTRARKTMVILGTRKAVAIAVKNARTRQRNTIFRYLLEEKVRALSAE